MRHGVQRKEMLTRRLIGMRHSTYCSVHWIRSERVGSLPIWECGTTNADDLVTICSSLKCLQTRANVVVAFCAILGVLLSRWTRDENTEAGETVYPCVLPWGEPNQGGAQEGRCTQALGSPMRHGTIRRYRYGFNWTLYDPDPEMTPDP
jgi:hypothetical protein